MDCVTALPASGRLRVIQQTPSSTRRVTSSPALLSVLSWLMGLLGLGARGVSGGARAPSGALTVEDTGGSVDPGRRPRRRRRRLRRGAELLPFGGTVTVSRNAEPSRGDR